MKLMKNSDLPESALPSGALRNSAKSPCPSRKFRLSVVCIAMVILAFTGCSTFNRDWKKAENNPATANDIAGRWEGHWHSDVNGHNDALRCIITRQAPGEYQARYHAKYRKVLTFGYTVNLKAQEKDGAWEFVGEADLGWYAGGKYHYLGNATSTDFFSTYRSKYDHGAFKMARPKK